MSNLLMNEIPLMVQPSLAKRIGLNEALLLQQIHYWLSRSTKIKDGKPWIYNTIEEWHKQFPFWSVATIKRTISNLEKSELIITANYNRMSMDRTKWYSINYDVVDSLDNETNNSENYFSENTSEPSISSICTNAKNQGFEGFMDNKAEFSENNSISEPSISSICTNALAQNEPTIGSNCTNALAQNEPTNNHIQQHRLLTKNTTTTLSENLSTKDVVVDIKLLKKQLTITAVRCGIQAKNMKIFFSKYRLEDIQRQLALLEKNMSKGSIVNPAGWLRSALTNDYSDSQAESAHFSEEQKKANAKKAEERNILQLEALKKQQKAEEETYRKNQVKTTCTDGDVGFVHLTDDLCIINYKPNSQKRRSRHE